MKTNMRKTLSVILSLILVLANVSLVAFATEPAPNYTTSEDIVGYSAALVERVDLTNIPSFSYRKDDVDGEYMEWKISTAEELVEFAASVTADNGMKGETVYLANDIDLSTVENFAPVGGWTKGNWGTPAFCGTFDGQGYIIKNMSIIVPEETGITANYGYIGFFRCLGAGAVVKNLVFDENCVVSCCNKYNVIGPMGMLCGAIDSNKSSNTNLETDIVTISNCFVQGKVIHGGGVAGGIAPYAKGATVNIDHCTNAADLEPSMEVVTTSAGTMSAAEKSQKFGSRGVGGILGMVGEGQTASSSNFVKVIPCVVNISNSRNTGKVVGGKAPTGGIVGTLTTLGRPAGLIGSSNYAGQISDASAETKHLTIENCINNGEIGYAYDTESEQGLAGILGLNRGNGSQHLATIKNCKNYVTIVDAPVVTPEETLATNPGAPVNQIVNNDFIADATDATVNTVIAAVVENNTEAADQTDETLEEALWQDLVEITTPEPTPTPGGDTPSGDTPSGDTPSGDTPSGDTPSGDTPSGDTPSGDTPSGDTPSGDTPSGDNNETKAPETQAPAKTDEKKSGCGATVALVPVMMVTLGAAAVALKKKED